MKKKKIHVYAIIRIDDFLSDISEHEDMITVKKIVLDSKYAEEEVERLNQLNQEKGCKYFLQITRLEVNDQLVEAVRTQYESFE